MKVRVQGYRRNFYHEQQSARTVPKENNLVCYLEVNNLYHKRYSTAAAKGLKRRTQLSLELGRV
jgi:hypothetical protein